MQFVGRPADAFGFQLRDDANGPARQGMLDLLRDAFNHGWIANIDFDIPRGNTTARSSAPGLPSPQAQRSVVFWRRLRIQEGEGRLQEEEDLRSRKIKATSRTLPGRLDPEVGDQAQDAADAHHENLPGGFVPGDSQCSASARVHNSAVTADVSEVQANTASAAAMTRSSWP